MILEPGTREISHTDERDKIFSSLYANVKRELDVRRIREYVQCTQRERLASRIFFRGYSFL